ncbi:GIY-YIG nuclease family protein [bacterium]|nr:GIY-YIG nuclease family protein [bacterium]
MYYLYILRLKNGTLYKGITSDLRRRVKEHKFGKVKSTKHKRPLKLIHYEAYLLKSDAERRERFLKTTEGRRLLKLQLKDILRKLCSKGSSRHTTGRPVG